MSSNNNYKSLLHKIQIYFTDRFPILPLFIFTSLTAIAINTLFHTSSYLKIISISFIYLQFLFHIRILDEFKDYLYDKTNHADRPVQSGLISLKSLKIIGIINLLIIVILAVLISNLFLVLIFFISLLYTFLMYKEFFVSEYLRKRALLYLTSHEIVFIPLFIFFYSSLWNSIWIPNNISQISHFLFLILPITIIEFGRKMKHRKNHKGDITDDTYAFIWGEENSLRIFILLILLEGLLSLNIIGINHFVPIVINTLSLLLFLISFIHSKILIENNMIITTLIALLIPICLII